MITGGVPAEFTSETNSVDISQDQDIDTERIYTFKHTNGEIATGTILDIQARCSGIGSLPVKQAVSMAELYDMGMGLMSEEEERTKTEVEETEEETPEAEKSKETEKKSDNKPEGLTVSKKEAVQAEQPSAQEGTKQEAAASPTNLSDVARHVATGSKASGDSPPISSTPVASVEKVSLVKPAQEINGDINPSLEKPFQNTAAPVPKVEANIPEPAAIQAVEAYTLPQWEVESAIRQAQLENEPTLDASLATLHEDNLDDEKSSDAKIAFEDPQAEAEVYMPPELGTIASETNAELEKPYLGDMELTENYPFDELWQIPEEMPVSYMLEIDATEDLALPIGETEYSISPPENENAVISPEISVPVEEVEQTILLLAERIEEFEAEEAETAHQLLDEIVQKVEQARVSMEDMEDNVENPEDTSEAEEVEEELKELFIQLFDYVGIEYSLELIESCVKLVLREGMPELILTTEQEDDINTPQDEGTHEIIKRLLATISSIKKTVLHAYRLGKLALGLYSQELLLDLSAAGPIKTANY